MVLLSTVINFTTVHSLTHFETFHALHIQTFDMSVHCLLWMIYLSQSIETPCRIHHINIQNFFSSRGSHEDYTKTLPTGKVQIILSQISN